MLAVLALISGVLASGLALPFAGGLGLAARATTQKFEDLPTELRIPPLAQKSTMYAADGHTLIATFFDEDRVSVPLTKISKPMQDAIIAIEDSRFYEHGGADLRALARAAVNNKAGNETQGGSTLTMQYVKNVLEAAATTDEERNAAKAKNTGRKIREVRYAIALEKKLSKDEILDRYLNIAYFGAGAHGVQAAARRFFGVPASELTVPQAAMIAGLVQQPNRFDPSVVKNRPLTLDRRNIVLRRMEELGVITPEESATYRATDLALKITPSKNGCEAAYNNLAWFCDYARAVMLSDTAFGRTKDIRHDELFDGGVKIITTLDFSMQKTVQAGLEKWVDKANPVAGVVTMVEPGTGEVKALALSKDFGVAKKDNTATKLNLALNHSLGGSGGTQAGSTFKAFVLAAALKSGDYGANYTMFAPRRLDDAKPMQTCQQGDKAKSTDANWSTVNESQSENGTYTMRQAFASSINTWWVQMEEKTGVCEPATLAGNMGLLQADSMKPLNQVQTFTLGSNNVAPLDMAGAYATFAARGTFCRPIAILSVTSAGPNGKLKKWPVRRPDCKSVLDQGVADAVNYVARATVTQGSGRRAAMSGREMAGKTGTTQDREDAWFIGYTPNMVGTVTVWNPAPGKYSLINRTIGGRFYAKVQGANLPAPLWHDSVGKAIEQSGLTDENFVDPESSFLKGGSDPKSYRRLCTCGYDEDMAKNPSYYAKVRERRRNGGEAGATSSDSNSSGHGKGWGNGTGTRNGAGVNPSPLPSDQPVNGRHGNPRGGVSPGAPPPSG